MKIGIIGAMSEEVALLRENIDVTSVEIVAGCVYTIGRMFGQEVILLQSGIGKVNAAMSTAVLLDKFQPDCLINAGSAGGFANGLKVGDIVLSTEVVHHDVDVTAFGYVHGQVPQLPPTFGADEKLLTLAYREAQGLSDIKAVKGLIATGDSFINTPAQRASIDENFQDVLAAEMEAAAIAQVAHQFQVPFVIIRSLSDIAGEDSGISFEQYLEKAAKNSAELIMKMVRSL